MQPIVKFLSKNIFKSIIGNLAVNSLIRKRIMQVTDNIDAILISFDFNQSNLVPSCNVTNNSNRPIANKVIP